MLCRSLLKPQVLLVRTVGHVSIITLSNSSWQGKHEEDFGVGRVRWIHSSLSVTCQLCSQSRQWRSFVWPGCLVPDDTDLPSLTVLRLSVLISSVNERNTLSDGKVR